MRDGCYFKNAVFRSTLVTSDGGYCNVLMESCLNEGRGKKDIYIQEEEEEEKDEDDKEEQNRIGPV